MENLKELDANESYADEIIENLKVDKTWPISPARRS